MEQETQQSNYWLIPPPQNCVNTILGAHYTAATYIAATSTCALYSVPPHEDAHCSVPPHEHAHCIAACLCVSPRHVRSAARKSLTLCEQCMPARCASNACLHAVRAMHACTLCEQCMPARCASNACLHAVRAHTFWRFAGAHLYRCGVQCVCGVHVACNVPATWLSVPCTCRSGACGPAIVPPASASFVTE
jgi:hypothetical protein